MRSLEKNDYLILKKFDSIPYKPMVDYGPNFGNFYTALCPTYNLYERSY